MAFTLQDLAEVFSVDGSWRDVCVQETTAKHWNLVLDWLRQSPERLRFTVDGEPAPMPAGIAEIRALRQQSAPALTCDLDGLVLMCHFFCEDEIELDLNPREMTEARLRALLAFLREVGDLLRLDVLVTPESMHECQLLRYDTGRRRFVCLAESGEQRWEP